MNGIVYPIVLAAGGSSRFGRAKQLLQYRGRSLLQNAICAAGDLPPVFDDIEINRPIVVLGANAESIAAEVDLDGVQVLTNDNWATGMASSIRLAVEHIASQSPPAAGVIFLLADQPYVSTKALLRILQNRPGDPQTIVVSRFENSAMGPPVYFGRHYFDELSSIDGDIGARQVIQAHREKVLGVDFVEGSFDIDTPQDYKNLLADFDA